MKRRLIELWIQHQRRLLWWAVAALIVSGAVRSASAHLSLIFNLKKVSAIDLIYRQIEVQAWFAGQPVYGEIHHAVYPPATYLLLWPLLGWTDLVVARVLWGLISLPLLVWTGRFLARESGAEPGRQALLLALLPFSAYAPCATVLVGQLPVFLLPALLTSLLLVHRSAPGWRRDITAAALFTVALAKPSLTIPFFWLLLLAPGGLRPALLSAAAYLGLTAWSTAFQPGDPIGLFLQWVYYADDGAAWGGGTGGYANLSSILTWLDAEALNLPLSLGLLIGAGIWLDRHRRRDLWLLLGAVGLLARFWTYHRIYDDYLVLLPLVALFRVARAAEGDRALVAGLLFFLTWAGANVPGTLLFTGAPWPQLFVTWHNVVWSLDFIFLFWLLRRDQETVPRPASATDSGGRG